MAISDTLQAMNQAVGDAKTAIATKGGSVGDTGLAGLASEISSIPADSTPKTVEQVYAEDRPADWMKMPTPAEGEAYMLIQVPDGQIDNIKFSLKVQSNSGGGIVEIGTTDSSGVFTGYPDSRQNTTTTSSSYFFSIPPSYFTNLNSEGNRQAIIRMTNLASWATDGSNSQTFLCQYVEYMDNRPGCSAYAGPAGTTSSSAWVENIRYVTCLGANRTASSLANRKTLRCYNCPGLNSSSFNELFTGCTNLLAVSSINSALVTSAYRMFYNCSNLKSIPNINTPNLTNAEEMFAYCGCESTGEITMSPTTTASMFKGCSRLKHINPFDTSNCTTFSGMFSSCTALVEVPLFDISSATTIASMFSTTNLTKLPSLVIPADCSAAGLISNCYYLYNVDNLDTSAMTNFNSMFSGSYLRGVPAIDTSAGTTFNNMFSGQSSNFYSNISCYDLSNYDFTNATSMSQMFTNSLADRRARLTLVFGDKWPASGIPENATFSWSSADGGSGDLRVKILKTDSMLPLNKAATTVFGTNTTAIYVPDDLVETYKADTYWGTKSRYIYPLSSWTA